MGEKGLTVLKQMLPFKSIVKQVVGAEDKDVLNDYYSEIKEFCLINKIKFYNKKDKVVLHTKYSIAIAWRWMISQGGDNQLIVLHDSLLPKYRGFSPLPSMLINREPKIGVTALIANTEYDKGDIIMQESVDVIYPVKINDAIYIISQLYAKIVCSILDIIVKSNDIPTLPQNESEASYSLWRNEEDYAIDWSRDATYIQQFIYSLGYPYKGASTFIDDIKYRILDCEVLTDVKVENRCPGKVIFVNNGCPVVVCGSGLLKITKMETEDSSSYLPLNKFRIRFK